MLKKNQFLWSCETQNFNNKNVIFEYYKLDDKKIESLKLAKLNKFK